jgi:membrane-bound lytic murein transglycosylase A
MVHHTINTNSKPAPRASSRIQVMQLLWRWLGWAIVGSLVACSSAPVRPPPSTAPTAESVSRPAPAVPSPPLVTPPPLTSSSKSRWVASGWHELPGWSADPLHEAWEALLTNCQRPSQVFAPLCPDVRRLSIADASDQRNWLMSQLQPYRVESLDGQASGLLTSYYEPVFEASRIRRPGFEVPLHTLPAALEGARRSGRSWYSRGEIESLPAAQEALRGREIAWLADPVDAMVLHIQGSGRLRLQEPDGRVNTVRLAFAGSNEQPYQSIGRWLLDQNLTRDATWPGIKAWLAANPQRTRELLAVNPRYIFFREEALPDPTQGPRGAQGVPLTSGRSIAVDPSSIPYATAVWLHSEGPAQRLQKLVVAQDTGSAIVGAVRADYFAGTGEAAGQVAGRLRQPLRLWVLWPKQASIPNP